MCEISDVRGLCASDVETTDRSSTPFSPSAAQKLYLSGTEFHTPVLFWETQFDCCSQMRIGRVKIAICGVLVAISRTRYKMVLLTTKSRPCRLVQVSTTVNDWIARRVIFSLFYAILRIWSIQWQKDSPTSVHFSDIKVAHKFGEVTLDGGIE